MKIVEFLLSKWILCFLFAFVFMAQQYKVAENISSFTIIFIILVFDHLIAISGEMNYCDVVTRHHYHLFSFSVGQVWV